MTELSPVGSMNDMKKEVLGSCGIICSLSEAKIVDLSTGEALPAYQRGELCIRGPQVTYSILLLILSQFVVVLFINQIVVHCCTYLNQKTLKLGLSGVED